MKQIVIFLMTIVFVTSCAGVKTVRYTIASQRADCMGEAPQKCLLVKKGDADRWQFFYSAIEGFEYREGDEYVLDVQEEQLKNPPADGSSIRYVLKREVSKTEKISDGLPQSTIKKSAYQVVGIAKAVVSSDAGRGAATGMLPVIVVEVEVTSSQNNDIKPGDTIYCELTGKPKVMPVEGREYVFKSPHKHLAHAKGIYLLETDVLDLTR